MGYANQEREEYRPRQGQRARAQPSSRSKTTQKRAEINRDHREPNDPRWPSHTPKEGAGVCARRCSPPAVPKNRDGRADEIDRGARKKLERDDALKVDWSIEQDEPSAADRFHDRLPE